MPNTERLHRVLVTTPMRVYRAFIEPDAMAKWLPPNGFTCTVHQWTRKAGGSYVELVPNEQSEAPNSPVRFM